MRFTAACVAALASVASAVPGWFDAATGQDVITADAPAVPGANPLTFCYEDRSEDLIEITSVDLNPNPPSAGQSLLIKASGNVLETIEKGAYVKIVVKYGLIRILTTTLDLCEQTEQADIACPIKKGPLSVSKSVDIPNEVPPGKYTVHAEIYTVEDAAVTCLDAVVTFGAARGLEL